MSPKFKQTVQVWTRKSTDYKGTIIYNDKVVVKCQVQDRSTTYYLKYGESSAGGTHNVKGFFYTLTKDLLDALIYFGEDLITDPPKNALKVVSTQEIHSMQDNKRYLVKYYYV